jgi:hypothetical protein
MNAKDRLATERAMMRERGMVSAKEAAEMMQVTITTIYHWMDDGKLDGEFVHGWRRYVTIESLAKLAGPTMAEKLGLTKKERTSAPPQT